MGEEGKGVIMGLLILSGALYFASIIVGYFGYLHTAFGLATAGGFMLAGALASLPFAGKS